MNCIIDQINTLNKTMKSIDIYIQLMEDYDDYDIELAFWSGFGITFNKTELELKEVRKKQLRFRRDLIARYQHCIITHIPDIMCEACHIVPFCMCSEQQKYDINNGLLLDAGIHKLYDMHMLRINPLTSKIELSKEILTNAKYKHLYRYNKQKIDLSRETIDYLRLRENIYNKKT